MTQLPHFLLNSEVSESASHRARWAAWELWDHSSPLSIARSKGSGVSPSRHPPLFVAESYGELPYTPCSGEMGDTAWRREGNWEGTEPPGGCPG